MSLQHFQVNQVFSLSLILPGRNAVSWYVACTGHSLQPLAHQVVFFRDFGMLSSQHRLKISPIVKLGCT